MADNREGAPIEVWAILAFVILFGIVAVPNALARAAEPLVFEAAVVHVNTENMNGCRLGPGPLQYTCWGTVPKLLAESFGLVKFQFEEGNDAATRSLQNYTARLATNNAGKCCGIFLPLNCKPCHISRRGNYTRQLHAWFLTTEVPALVAKAAEGVDPIEELSPSGRPITRLFMTPSPQGGKIVLKDATLHELVELLALYSSYGPVVDATNETRRFNFEFIVPRV
jgi:hypothetical protein